jgi:hypothetical protein
MRRGARLLLAAASLALAGTAWSQTVKLPADAVDGFHAALKRKDTGGALSYLDRSLLVFEFGVTDPTVEAYALSHLPGDIDMAAVSDWTLQARRVKAIVRRAGESFRIVHFHWSSDKAWAQPPRVAAP